MAGKSIGAVICAYNEAANIHRVLNIVCKFAEFNQIVVVDDGSADTTCAIAQGYANSDLRIHVVRLTKNRGKAGAMLAGLQALTSEVVMFLDADMVGLETEHLARLYSPVDAGFFDVAVALFRNGGLRTEWSHRLTPWLSGQRCMRRQMAYEALAPVSHSRFGAETRLMIDARRRGLRTHYVTWNNVTHVMKEQKLGVIAGTAYRFRMYMHIIAMLYHSYAPKDICAPNM